MVKLLNGDILTFNHAADIDCSNTIIVGKLLPGEMSRLRKSKIKVIRLHGAEYYDDFSELEYPDFLMKKMDCIK